MHQYAVRMKKKRHKLTYILDRESVQAAELAAYELAPEGYEVFRTDDWGPAKTMRVGYTHPIEPQVDTHEEDGMTSMSGAYAQDREDWREDR